MTDTEIIIAVAKLDGLTIHTVGKTTFCWSEERNKSLPPNDDGMIPVPKYLTSRDAIIPVIEKILGSNKMQLYEFYKTLKIMIFGEDFISVEEDEPMIHQYLIAEPKTLCIALLKATNNWPKE